MIDSLYFETKMDLRAYLVWSPVLIDNETALKEDTGTRKRIIEIAWSLKSEGWEFTSGST